MTTEQARGPEQPIRIEDRKPDFKAGKFVINALATSPEGLEVSTDRTLTRRQGRFAVGQRLPIPEDKREPIKKGMRFEVATALQNAGVEFPNPEPEDPLLAQKRARIEEELLPSEQREEYHEKLAEAQRQVARRRRIEEMTSGERIKYLLQFQRSMKTGARNIKIEGNNVTLDVVSVPFPFYRNIDRPTESADTLSLADVAATAAVFRTSDRMLVVQHRSEKNSAYGDISGASAAGLMEGEIERRGRPGTLKGVNTGKVLNNGATEASEELGVKKGYGRVSPIDTQSIKEFVAEKASSETGEDAADIRRLRITGIATDNRKYHHEFLLYGELRHNAKELLEEARRAKQERGDKFDPVDFEEQFFFIPATPQAIETLLTDIKCPVPDTHVDAFIAAGYTMLLESDGLEAAKKWIDEMQTKVGENYNQIDEIVRNHHISHPEVARQKPKINTEAYDPNFLPSEQGLPSLDDELERTGIEEVIEKTVGSSYLFDVDGVLTDIEQRRVTQEEMFDEIIRRLEVSPISFNTGRSLEWVTEKVLNPLKEHIRSTNKNVRMLSNLFVVAESGGVWATIDKKGNIDKNIDEYLKIPADLADEAMQLLENRYSYVVSNLDPKTTIVTYEENVGFDQTEFDDIKMKIKADLEALVATHGLSEQLKVDATTIAIDLRSVNSGKNVGARKFLSWLEDRKIQVKTFYTFGDSESDIEMAEELEKDGQNVHHEHFGNKLSKEQHLSHPRVSIEEPTRRFSEAVLKYLQDSEI